MTTEGVRVRAHVKMHAPGKVPKDLPLRAGWGANILFDDKFYPGMIIECESPIPPGEEGDILVGIIGLEADGLSLQEGSTFELRAGPAVKIAEAKVIKIL